MSVVVPATPTAEDLWGRAQQLVERAELDVGAASLAAAAGDHDIAYALMTDAAAGWRQAVDLLRDVVEGVAAGEPPTVGDPTSVDGADLFAELSAAPAEADGALVIDLRDAAGPGSDVIEELDARAGEPAHARVERARRRRRVPKGTTGSDERGTVDLSERIGSLVPVDGTAEEYQAWVDRLRERRHELKEAAGDIDLAAVHRSPMPPNRRRWARDLTPPPW